MKTKAICEGLAEKYAATVKETEIFYRIISEGNVCKAMKAEIVERNYEDEDEMFNNIVFVCDKYFRVAYRETSYGDSTPISISVTQVYPKTKEVKYYE